MSTRDRHQQQLRINGEARSVREWSEIAGTPRHTIYTRLKAGWPADDAVFGRGADYRSLSLRDKQRYALERRRGPVEPPPPQPPPRPTPAVARPNCSTCMFCVPVASGHECRRNPPTQAALWPTTTTEGWCGEYRRLQKGDP